MRHAKIAEVAAKTPHLREALDALRRGELTEAESILTGNGDSLYQVLLTTDGVGAIAALNFKTAIGVLFTDPITRGLFDGLDDALGDEAES